MLAVIGLGSNGVSVTGFEAASPAHGRSTVGGDTRVLRMLCRGNPDYCPRSFEGWTSSGPSVSAHDSWPPDSFLRLLNG